MARNSVTLSNSCSATALERADLASEATENPRRGKALAVATAAAMPRQQQKFVNPKSAIENLTLRAAAG